MADEKSWDKTENISVSVPSFLLEELEHLCAHQMTNRSAFIVKCIRRGIAGALSEESRFWKERILNRE